MIQTAYDPEDESRAVIVSCQVRRVQFGVVCNWSPRSILLGAGLGLEFHGCPEFNISINLGPAAVGLLLTAHRCQSSDHSDRQIVIDRDTLGW